MWFITHIATDESVFLLPEKLKYTVGRLGADIELHGDICVSRAHAAFYLVKDKDYFNLELEDLGSKYGTYHNKGIEKNTTLEKSQRVNVKNNDLIRFGRLQNVWKVQYMKIATAISSLSKEDIVQLNTYISALGGQVLEQWSPICTHLTMKDPSITLKLLHALINQKHVVTPDYWKDLLNAVNNKRSHLPKPDLYRPDYGDDEIDFGCNSERRSLFKGCTFVFLHRKHFDMYSPIIKSAGGACKDLNSGVQKVFLIKDKVVVVQYTPSTQTQSSQTISTIAEFLESNSKRIIPEYEIGLAILHCSIEKFCNPSFKMTQTMLPTVSNEPAEESIRIDFTEQQNIPSNNTESIDFEIPETNQHLATSTPYVDASNLNTNTKEGETITDMHKTENQRKRKINKVLSVDLDESDDEGLFQFQSKKTCNKNEKEKTDKSISKENQTTKLSVQKAEEQTLLSNDKNTSNKEIPSTSKSKPLNFFQKTQAKNKSQNSTEETESPPTNKETRKRPRIQVLDENDEGDDDDLFSFGDTQKAKKTRSDNDNRTKDDNNLFSFKERDISKTRRPMPTINVEEDSEDLEPTQKFIVSETTNTKSSIQMPKPKVLPRKISAIDWISSSFRKINIKTENSVIVKDKVVKTEMNIKAELDDDLNITEDHRKWLDSLKNAIEIQQVSLNKTIKCGDKSHYKFKNRSHNLSENLNDTIPNFKKFVKKYRAPPQHTSAVIKLHLC